MFDSLFSFLADVLHLSQRHTETATQNRVEEAPQENNQHTSQEPERKVRDLLPVRSGHPLTRSTSVQGSRIMPAKARHKARMRPVSDVHRFRARRERRMEGIIASLFTRFFYGQGVIFGDIPTSLPRGQVHVVSESVDVPPYCWHIRCDHTSGHWRNALALQGFDWAESTVWLLRAQRVPDPALLRLLRAMASMSAPCSVVLLVSWSSLAKQIADEAGFSVDVVQYRKPLYILRRKERHARCDETESPYTSPPYSPPPEPFDGCLAEFELRIESLPREVQKQVAGGSVRVVGNCDELGNWVVDDGLSLLDRGYMLTENVFVPRELEYKYVVVNASGDVLWESGENRILPNSSTNVVRVHDRWRH